MLQEYTSKSTSRNQLPKLFRSVNFRENTTILDIGSGKYYDKLLWYCDKQLNIKCLVYDPYNIGNDINTNSLYEAKLNKVDGVTCANVLNVIKEVEIRESIYKLAKDVLRNDGKVYFSVYEGNKSGIGYNSITDCWQNNCKTIFYVSEISKYFKHVSVKGNIITAFN